MWFQCSLEFLKGKYSPYQRGGTERHEADCRAKNKLDLVQTLNTSIKRTKCHEMYSSLFWLKCSLINMTCTFPLPDNRQWIRIIFHLYDVVVAFTGDRNSQLRGKIKVHFNNALPAAYVRDECYDGLWNVSFKGAVSKRRRNLDTKD
jgi:hypothetical protein